MARWSLSPLLQHLIRRARVETVGLDELELTAGARLLFCSRLIRPGARCVRTLDMSNQQEQNRECGYILDLQFTSEGTRYKAASFRAGNIAFYVCPFLPQATKGIRTAATGSLGVG